MASSSADLVLKPSCERCGSAANLYGTGCKHTTLCLDCGKSAAVSRVRCAVCAAPVSRLIREYNVRAGATTDKSFYIGRFVTGLPPFSKKSTENKWSLHKEGLQGRQLTENMREKLHKKPWIMEDETGQYQYQGQLEGSQSSNATYYLLMLQGREFHAYPTSSMYNFSKIAQYKQLTLEEAEEKMNKRRHNATGYERWMMKSAVNGAATFGVDAKKEEAEVASAQAGRPKKVKNEDDASSDKGEEDGEEEAARKHRLGLNKKGMDDDEEGGKGADFDLDDDDIEKGDDWEHEEIFTDDDEAVGNDPEERQDLAPEIPAPPEIKQDEDEEGEEEGGLSNSGKELKKLLGKAAGVNDSDADDDDDDDEEDENGISPVLAPKHKEAPKPESVDNSPAKGTPGGTSKTAAGSKSSKSKRKATTEDGKSASASASKKLKTEIDTKPSVVKTEKVKTEIDTKPSIVKEEFAPTKAPASAKASATPSSSRAGTDPVTEEEIRSVFLSSTPVTTQDLVAKFRPRLKSKEDKDAFAAVLRKIGKIQKTNGNSFIVLRQ